MVREGSGGRFKHVRRSLQVGILLAVSDRLRPGFFCCPTAPFCVVVVVMRLLQVLGIGFKLIFQGKSATFHLWFSPQPLVVLGSIAPTVL